jgi:hypothetical protein
MSHPYSRNPDHIRNRQVHAPSNAAINNHLQTLLSPLIYNQQPYYRSLRMRERILTLPLMVAAILTLLWWVVGISQFYTDGWGAYQRHLNPADHSVGKRNTQKIERKHLTLRTRIKRLVRKTICFSKTIVMHDTVIGLFINRFEFGLDI